MSYFDFKQFRVYHDRCAMKVGTDGVLLGAWAPAENATRILDIGAGSGLISLMLAQRSEATIVGVELDEAAALQARENVEQSRFASRIEIVNADILHYTSEAKFDLIVSNPPFFNDALECPDKQRTQARHTSSLPLHLLIDAAFRLLHEGGLFSVILPTDVAGEFISNCIVKHFTPIHLTAVKTTPKKNPKRALITLKKGVYNETFIQDELILSTPTNIRSEQYTELTRDFYLDKE